MRTIGILSPSLRLKGGVSNHVRRLIGYLSSSPEYVVEEYVPGHARLEADKKIVVRLRDFRSLVKRLRCHDLLVYNPSLQNRSVLFTFSCIYLVKRNYVIFWHGWDKQILRTPWRLLVEYIGKGAKHNYVLASEFKEDFLRLGINNVDLFTTQIPDSINYIDRHKEDLVYFGRIENSKGVFKVLDIWSEVKDNCSLRNLHIVGQGNDFKELKQRVKELEDSRILIHGALNHSELEEVLSTCSLFIFPTRHTEGMPTTVLEALGSGVRVVSSRVGGLIDIWEDDYGILLDWSSDINAWVHAVKMLCQQSLDKGRDFNKTISLKSRGKFGTRIVADNFKTSVDGEVN